jgi:cytochrome P450
MVLNEATRLYPPGYNLVREVARPVEIAGYRIGRGSQVQFPVFITHRDPRWFEAPDEFWPERFLPEQHSRHHACSFMPFGVGPRTCVGAHLGVFHGVLILAALLDMCRLHLMPGQEEPELDADIVLHPRGGLNICLAPRSAGALRV